MQWVVDVLVLRRVLNRWGVLEFVDKVCTIIMVIRGARRREEYGRWRFDCA